MDPLDLAEQWSGLTLTALGTLGTLGPPIYLRVPSARGSPRVFGLIVLRGQPSATYDLETGGSSQPSSRTARSASIRLDTFNAFRIAVT